MGIINKFKNWRKEWRKKRFRTRMRRINPNPFVYKIWEHKRWGDSIQINKIYDNNAFRIVGWLKRLPKNGDKLLYETESGKILSGYIVNVDYCRDPGDMFFADVIPFEYVNLKDDK